MKHLLPTLTFALAFPFGLFAQGSLIQVSSAGKNKQKAAFMEQNLRSVESLGPRRSAITTTVQRPSRSEEYTWSRDSVKWHRYVNAGYSYDTRANQTRRATWSYSLADSSTRQMYYFDLMGNDTLFTFESRDRASGQWIYFFRDRNSYDASGRLLTYISEDYQAGAWVPSIGLRYLNTFDSFNRITEEISQLYGSGAWADDGRNTYVYPADTGGFSSETRGGSNGSGGFNDTLMLDRISWRNFALSQTDSFHVSKFIAGNWVEQGRQIYTWSGVADYDVVNQTYAGGQYVNNQREVFTQTATQTDQTLYAWVNGAWVGSSRRQLFRDGFGNSLGYSAARFISGAWVENDAQRFVLTTLPDGTIQQKIRYDWNTDSARAVRNYRTDFFDFSNITASKSSKTLQGVQFGPNPTADQLTLMLPTASPCEARLLDAQGRLAGIQSSAGQWIVFPMSSLASGVYTLRLILPNGTGTYRVVKE